MINSENLINCVQETMRKYRTIQCVDVIIDRQPYQWDEPQVRAFQIIAKKASDKEFIELKKKVKIYSGPNHKVMKIRRDGKFENKFEGGFLDGNAKMAFEIF